MIQVDTNVLLRILLNDIPEQSEAAARYLDSAAENGEVLFLAAATASEIVFVLGGRNVGLAHADLVTAVARVLSFPLAIQDRPVVEGALDLFAHHHDDWDDCLLAAYALERTGGRIASFDRGFDGIPGIERLDPMAIP